MDLNIIVHADKQRDGNDIIIKKIKAAAKLGFKHIALSVVISGQDIASMPDPPSVEFNATNDLKLQVLTRLTVMVDDPLQTHKLVQSATLKKYDLLAVEALSEKILNLVCGGHLDCDILCFTMSERLLVNMKKANFSLPRTRGICFEINYNECLNNQTNRQNVISAGQLLVEKTKGRHVIISSGTRTVLGLRGPYDASNIGLLFTLKENQAKESVFKNGFKAIKHGQGRLNVNSNAVIVSTKLEDDEKWLAGELGLTGNDKTKNLVDEDEPQSKKVKLET